MSGSTTTLVTDVPEASKNYKVKFTTCTDKQGRNYPVININGQTWMAENLALLPSVSPSEGGSMSSPYYYIYGYQGTDVKRALKSKNFAEYGVLYNWEAARGGCPQGWKLPSDADWKKMEKFLGMNEINVAEKGWRLTGEVGSKLKERGNEHWNTSNVSSSDEVAFNARPGGIRLMPFPGPEENDDSGNGSYAGPFGTFSNLGICGIYWTSSATNPRTAWNRRFGCVEGGVERMTMNKSLGFSVRCIKDRPEE